MALVVMVELEVLDDHTDVGEEGLLPKGTRQKVSTPVETPESCSNIPNCIVTIMQTYGGDAPSSITSDGGVSVVLQNESLPLERLPPDIAQVPSFGGIGDFVKTP